jgi:hypothetical protein
MFVCGERAQAGACFTVEAANRTCLFVRGGSWRKWVEVQRRKEEKGKSCSVCCTLGVKSFSY